MKTLKYLFTVLGLLITIISCTGGISKQKVSDEDLKNLFMYTPGKVLHGKILERTRVDSTLQSSHHIRQLFFDQKGYLWYGTYLLGFGVYDGENQFRFETPGGTNGNIVRKITEDQQGNIWMATNLGLLFYDQSLPTDLPDSYKRYTTREGLPSNQIWSVCNDRKGGIWIGTENGLVYFDGKSFHTYQLTGNCDNKPANSYATMDAIMALHLDNNGKLWIGTNGRGVFTMESGNPTAGFQRYTVMQGLCDNTVHCITTDQAGNIWIGTKEGGISKYDGRQFTNYNTTNGLSSNFIWTITEDRFGQLWIGTAGSGAMCFNGKSFTLFNEEDGLVSNYVQSILEDKTGNIWFGTGIGITRYNGNHLMNTTPERSKTTKETNQQHMQSYPDTMNGC